MPLFLCRWPNGDCSVVWARNKDAAIEALDQVGNAEGCPITPVHEFQMHCALTDRGELALEGLGDGTGPAIVAWAYPMLDRALAEAYGDGAFDNYDDLPPDRRAAIARAVEEERRRIDVGEPQIPEPLTELGRNVKRQMDLPTVLIDRAVRRAATKTLKRLRGRAKPS
jgi:hypothetical protein